MKTFSKDAFEFREARIVCGNKEAGLGVRGRMGRCDGMRMEATGNLFGYGEGLSGVGNVDVEMIRVVVDLPPMDGVLLEVVEFDVDRSVMTMIQSHINVQKCDLGG